MKTALPLTVLFATFVFIPFIPPSMHHHNSDSNYTVDNATLYESKQEAEANMYNVFTIYGIVVAGMVCLGITWHLIQRHEKKHPETYRT